jgi:hypothetical protein
VKRGPFLALAASLVIVIAVATGVLWRCAGKGADGGTTPVVRSDGPADEATLARLERIPFYRPLIRAKALRSGHVDGEGTVHVEIDLRALVEPRLAAMGVPGASELLPRFARGTIAIERATRSAPTLLLRESWSFDGPAAALDLLDRNPGGKLATLALDAIPGAPSAVVRVRLAPKSLADPSLGGAALSSWRERADLAEKLLGRPLRAEIAEDLAGPAVFALYDGSDENEAEAVLAAELRRSDRLAALLDMIFGLGALTERATVRRYRGVLTGSFLANSGRSGLALAVDGPLLFVATSRGRLESAIDARRSPVQARGIVVSAGDGAASWNAVAASAFVRHGWARLTRTVAPAGLPLATTTASLWPEGASGWRLDGRGPAPAITADPVLPFFRSVLGGRQGAGD